MTELTEDQKFSSKYLFYENEVRPCEGCQVTAESYMRLLNTWISIEDMIDHHVGGHKSII